MNSANPSSDEKQIREAIAEWMRATSEGNLDKILTLMADDVVFLLPTLEPMRGKDAFAAGFRVVAERCRIEGKSEIREIRVEGSIAMCWNRLAITISPKTGGLPRYRKGDVLSIFRKEADGRWLLWRDANLLTEG